MKRNIIIACALALGSSLAWSEDYPSQPKAPTTTSNGEFLPLQIQLFDSSRIENQKVTDKDGKYLGKVGRLLVDSLTGRVRFVVLEVDKEWSLNNPEIIVPWGTLQITPQSEKMYSVRIDATRDKLMNAPQFDKALTAQLTTREAGQPIYSYWGVTWQDEINRSGTETTLSPLPSATPGSEPNVNITPPTSITPSPSGVSSALPPAQPGTPPAPTTTTDGSTSIQSLGNSGTSDSPKPDSKLGQPAPKEPAIPRKAPDSTLEPKKPESSTDPERSLGEDETD